jgi:hypothetical protein
MSGDTPGPRDAAAGGARPPAPAPAAAASPATPANAAATPDAGLAGWLARVMGRGGGGGGPAPGAATAPPAGARSRLSGGGGWSGLRLPFRVREKEGRMPGAARGARGAGGVNPSAHSFFRSPPTHTTPQKSASGDSVGKPLNPVELIAEKVGGRVCVTEGGDDLPSHPVSHEKSLSFHPTTARVDQGTRVAGRSDARAAAGPPV